jgi:hypothetical protein
MFSPCRLDTVVRNMRGLAASAGAPPGAPLRRRYHWALNALQDQVSYPYLDAGAVFDTDPATPAARRILRCLGPEAAAARPYAVRPLALVTTRAEQAQRLLRGLDATAARVTDLLVGCYLFADSPDSLGGTTAEALGVVWLSPPVHWGPEDYVDGFWHDALHQCLYLDDLIDGYFTADGRRPYLRAFHAAAVTAGRLEAYRRVGAGRRLRRLRPVLGHLLDRLDEGPGQLTPRGREVLAEMHQVVAPGPIRRRTFIGAA